MSSIKDYSFVIFRSGGCFAEEWLYICEPFQVRCASTGGSSRWAQSSAPSVPFNRWRSSCWPTETFGVPNVRTSICTPFLPRPCLGDHRCGGGVGHYWLTASIRSISTYQLFWRRIPLFGNRLLPLITSVTHHQFTPQPQHSQPRNACYPCECLRLNSLAFLGRVSISKEPLHHVRCAWPVWRPTDFR